MSFVDYVSRISSQLCVIAGVILAIGNIIAFGKGKGNGGRGESIIYGEMKIFRKYLILTTVIFGIPWLPEPLKLHQFASQFTAEIDVLVIQI